MAYMADDKSKTGPADRSRINVNEPYELQFWSNKFGVTPDALKAVALAVGTSVKAVENFLRPEK